MSNEVNSQFLDRVAEMMEYWEGTLVSEALQKAMDDNDLERLRYLLLQAEAEASRIEMEAADVA